VRDRVTRLKQLGHELLQRPGQYRTGQAVLEEALAFYQQMLPEDRKDLAVRRDAAQLYLEVAEIYSYLGQLGKAVEAYDQRAILLNSLLEEDPHNKAFRLTLADAHRWRGNMLRDLGKTHDARQAYDQAAQLHEELLREFPNMPGYQVALANTLLN